MSRSRRSGRSHRAAGPLRALVAVLAGAAMLISGCSGVPSSSSPDVVREIGGLDEERTVPSGPLPGDDPRAIVAGFLDANYASDARHASARQYLTAEAAATWQDSPVNVVSSLPAASLDGDTATIPIRRVGRVDTAGAYTPTLTDPASSETLSFGLTQVNGEWRIDDLQPGLWVTTETFQRAYRAQTLYFWDSTETVLVPDIRYSTLSQQALATFLLEQLLDPRRTPLSQSLITRIPPDQPRPAVVLNPGGTTDIELVSVRQAPADAIPKIAAQLAYTFSQLVVGADLRIVENGSPVPVFGADGRFSRADFGLYSVDPGIVSRVFYVRDGAIMKVPSGDPVAGNGGNGSLALTSVAATTGEETLRLAAVGGPGGRTLYLGDEDGPLQAVTLPDGVDGPLTRPSWSSRAREVWVSDQDHLLRVSSTGVVTPVSVLLQSGESADGRITALRMSRDGARIALIYGTGEDDRSLYVGSVVRVGQDVRVEPLVKVTSSAYRLTDVAWNDTARLVVVGRARGASADGMWTVQFDGALLVGQDLDGLPVAELTSVTASPSKVFWVAVDNAVWEQRNFAVWSRGLEDPRGGAPVYVE